MKDKAHLFIIAFLLLLSLGLMAQMIKSEREYKSNKARMKVLEDSIEYSYKCQELLKNQYQHEFNTKYNAQ